MKTIRFILCMLTSGLASFLLFSCGSNKNAKESKPYKRDGSIITFGKYPQSLVEDIYLIDQLNIKAGQLPTAENQYNWKKYDYYINDNIASFMFYIDIDYNDDKAYDYRGVYFIQYRPRSNDDSSSADNSYQDDNEFYTNEVYWFN